MAAPSSSSRWAAAGGCAGWSFCALGWKDRPSKSDEPEGRWIHVDSKKPRARRSSAGAGGWLVTLGFGGRDGLTAAEMVRV